MDDYQHFDRLPGEHYYCVYWKLVSKVIWGRQDTVWNLIIGTVNTRLAVHKAAEIHLTINDEQLEIVAVTETCVPLDTPDAISVDIAPTGYTISNATHQNWLCEGECRVQHRLAA